MQARCHLDDCAHGPNCVHAKPLIDPAKVNAGRDIRRRPGGRGCSVERLSQDRRKVLVRDNGRCFWVRMDTLVRDWY